MERDSFILKNLGFGTVFFPHNDVTRIYEED